MGTKTAEHLLLVLIPAEFLNVGGQKCKTCKKILQYQEYCLRIPVLNGIAHTHKVAG